MQDKENDVERDQIIIDFETRMEIFIDGLDKYLAARIEFMYAMKTFSENQQ